MEEQLDRVSCSMGVKVNIGNYESRDVYMSYSTDVRDNEDQGQAMSRARLFIEYSLLEEERAIRSGKKGVEPPTPETGGSLKEFKADTIKEYEIFKEQHPNIAEQMRTKLKEAKTKEDFKIALEAMRAYDKSDSK